METFPVAKVILNLKNGDSNNMLREDWGYLYHGDT